MVEGQKISQLWQSQQLSITSDDSATPKKQRTERQKRVGAQIRRILLEALSRAEFQDVLDGALFVAISDVHVGPDLRNATCYVDAQENETDDCVKQRIVSLNANAQRLQRLLASQIRLKYLPRLYFTRDHTAVSTRRIHDLLNSEKVKRDLEK